MTWNIAWEHLYRISIYKFQVIVLFGGSGLSVLPLLRVLLAPWDPCKVCKAVDVCGEGGGALVSGVAAATESRAAVGRGRGRDGH